MIRVAVDAMGSDHAPQAEVGGAVEALAGLPGSFVVRLVGQPDVIEAELAKHPTVDRGRLEIHEAADVIGMSEKPLAAVRKKPNSSLVVGLGLVKSGQADAFVSAGNTGAHLAAATLTLGLHEGVERATVGAMLPTATSPVLIIDAGANVDCTARELVNFALLGSVYMRDLQGRENPAVGLLNVGEEDEKGNELARAAHSLLKHHSRINFIGNIEGRDVVEHRGGLGLDVVVCDGFVGNVMLKFYESAARFFVGLVRERVPEVFERPSVHEMVRFLDWSEYGGAPLLGVKGITIICHGASSTNAMKSAIRVALQSVQAGLSQHVGAEFAQRETAAPA